MLLTDLLIMAYSTYFLIDPAPPAQGSYYLQWAGPLPDQSLIKKMLYRFAYSPTLWRIFSVESLSFQKTLACVKLTVISIAYCCDAHKKQLQEERRWLKVYGHTVHHRGESRVAGDSMVAGR